MYFLRMRSEILRHMAVFAQMFRRNTARSLQILCEFVTSQFLLQSHSQEVRTGLNFGVTVDEQEVSVLLCTVITSDMI